MTTVSLTNDRIGGNSGCPVLGEFENAVPGRHMGFEG